jgi:hypothetical protein
MWGGDQGGCRPRWGGGERKTHGGEGRECQSREWIPRPYAARTCRDSGIPPNSPGRGPPDAPDHPGTGMAQVEAPHRGSSLPELSCAELVRKRGIWDVWGGVSVRGVA